MAGLRWEKLFFAAQNLSTEQNCQVNVNVKMLRNFKINKTVKIILISIAGLLLAGLLFITLAKGWILDKAVLKIQQKLKNDYALTLSFKKYSLHGFTELEMNGISCKTAGKDTLAYFDNVRVKIKPLAILTGRLRLRNIAAKSGLIDLSRLREIKSSGTAEITDIQDTTRFGRIKKYVNYFQRLAALVPDEFSVSQIRMRYKDSVDNINAFIDSATYADEKINSAMILSIKGEKQLWRVQGTFDKSSLETDVKLSTNSNKFYSLNMVKKLAKADIGFRSVVFKLDELDDDNDEIVMLGSVRGENVFLYNPRLSKDTVFVRNGALDFDLSVTPDKISLRNNSKVTLNEIQSIFQADYKYTSPESISMLIDLPKVNAQSIINSLPKGTFEKMQGMQIAGDMSYKLNFYLDLHNKDSVNIDSDPEAYNLQVLKYGAADLSKLNTSFTYYPYNSKRGIIVGPENPSFVTLNNISPYLRNAILTSEDPSFFRHKGFVEEAFEQSFLENLQKGRFSRGGSTISMQLVKNVFLSHQKTIDRKLEETLLVWLLENLHVSSKSRMYEVYMNIIEWGPNVYGVGEAARFYFNKHPGELTLNESIYLAIIIPKPLAFAYRFDDYGNLKPYVQRKGQFIANLMRRRGLASFDSTFTPNVYINGPARNLIKIKPDTMQMEDTNLEDDLEWEELF
ncbi:MAG: transglycosylase domain-containing protein [Bacteroidia bacterium]